MLDRVQPRIGTRNLDKSAFAGMMSLALTSGRLTLCSMPDVHSKTRFEDMSIDWDSTQEWRDHYEVQMEENIPRTGDPIDPHIEMFVDIELE
jgi:hypothetical protein